MDRRSGTAPGQQAGSTFRILVLDTAARTHNAHIAVAVVDALRRHPAVALVRQAGYGSAIEVFRRERCDTLLALGGAGGDLAVIARLCAMASRAALWTTEDPYELDENVRVAASFDAVFSNDLASLPLYGGGARHLPLAASRLLHDIEPVTEEDEFLYDLSFVGTAWPNRVRTIDRLLAAARRPLRVKIALPTNEHLPAFELADGSLPTDWRVSNPELARIANRSRITLNLERKFSGSRPDQASGSTPPPRLFETALAGGFQISLGSGSEARRYFDPRGEVAFCETEDDLLDRVDWALDHPAERVEMARRARRRAASEHLYDHRVDAIVDVLAATAPRPRHPARASRPRVLLVTHNVAGNQPGGGVEVYQQVLADGAADFEILTLYPETEGASNAYTLVDHRSGTRSRYGVPHPAAPDALHDGQHERVFERILIETGVDLVHFQHLIRMPLSLPLIAKACGIPTIFTLHDFYLVCQSFNLINDRGRFCDIASRSPTECDICLAPGGATGDGQRRRRHFVARVIEAFDLLVANSPFTANYMRTIYPTLSPERVRIVEMLTPAATRPSVQTRGERDRGRTGPLQVAIPGNFTGLKGADAVLRIASAMRNDPVEFHVLGTLQDPEIEARMRALALPRLTIQGGYGASDLPRLLAGKDVSLHLSVWPETYMISLNEARAAGLVPIVTDLGAPAERVRDGVDGFRVAPDDVGRVCDLIRALDRDRGQLARMRDAVMDTRNVSPQEHIGQLGSLYRELIRARPVAATPIPLRPERDCILTVAACGTRTNSPSWRSEEAGWDTPAGSAEPPGAAPADIWRTFPARFGHLARRAAVPARVRACVDGVFGDRRPASGPVVALRRSFAISGWAFAEGFGPPLDVIVHLTGMGQELYGVSASVRREDVSQHLGQADAATAGYGMTLDLSGLPEGRYDATLIQVYPGVALEIGTVATIDIRSGASGASAPEPASGFDPGRSAAVTRRRGDAVLAGSESAAGRGGLVLAGWAADLANLRVLPAVHVGFVSRSDPPRWLEAVRCRAPAALSEADPLLSFCGVRLAVAPEALEPGLHRLLVAETDQAETIVHEIDGAVMARAGRLVLSAPDPAAGPGRSAVARIAPAPPDHHSCIDVVETDGPEPHRYLYLSGWIHVPSLGEASRLALHLAGDAMSLRVPLTACERPDVAQYLALPAAARAGFEGLVRLGSLDPAACSAELHYTAGGQTVVVPVDLPVERAVAQAA